MENPILDKTTFLRIFNRMQDNHATRQEVESLMEAMAADAELSLLFKELAVGTLSGVDDPESVEKDSAEKESDRRQTAYQEGKALDDRLQIQWEKILERSRKIPQNGDQTNTEREAVIIQTKEPKILPRTRSLVFRIAAVAILMIGLGWGLSYLVSIRQPVTVAGKSGPHEDEPVILKPGTDAAVLTLDNGVQIPLDSSTGTMIKQKQQLVAHNLDGQLDYQIKQTGLAAPQYNMLTTKKGNQYKLILPDGTRVWLNAESSIRFPTAFASASRTVELTGEAYFEVKHDASKPFKVKVRGQVIEDLGTSFNVNAYGNESVLKTTLVEGALRIQQTLMHPGEQAIIGINDHIEIRRDADIEQAVAWKNGLFIFHKTDMKTILRQVARWYNVDIIYEGEFNQTFTGGISRKANAEEILKILSYSDRVKFSIQGRKIIVQQRH